MRVLVTGGAGFIGSHLVDRFLEEGFQVRVLDSLDPKVHPYRQPNDIPSSVDFIQGDVTDPVTLLAALQDVDIVSHQAAYQDYMLDFSRFLHVNAVGTSLLYELIVQERLKVKKVIVASSQAVYGEGQYVCSVHGFFQPAPRSQEQLSLGLGWLHGIPSVALRYSITQGPRQSLFNQYSGVCRIFVGRALKREPLIIYEDGLQTRDFVHINDVVAANMRVLESDDANFQSFNVGSGNPTTVLEYANLVRGKLSTDVQMNLSGEYRRGDNRNSVSKVDKLKTLGWNPKYDLSAILDDFLAWVESIGGIPAQIQDAYGAMRKAGVVLPAMVGR